MRGYLYMLTADFLWGLIGPISQLTFAYGLTPLEVAFWRAVLGGFLFGAHAFWIGRIRVARRDLPIMLGFGPSGWRCFTLPSSSRCRQGAERWRPCCSIPPPPGWPSSRGSSSGSRWARISWPPYSSRFSGLTTVAGVSLQGGEVRIHPAGIGWGLVF